MLVVIPFCRKDEHLCLKNLELCKMLDGSYPFEALISTDTTCDVETVLKASESLFSKVSVLRYDPWKGESEWPVPENWAWQSTARYILSKLPKKECWLWWETDATPTTVGWLESLHKAWRAGGKPFAGHVVANDGYMQGVGIYPTNVPSIAPSAMFVRKHPFDKVLKEHTARQVTPLNGLIQYTWGPSSFPNHRAVKKTLTTQTVLFHRCKDGSLADRLMEMMDPSRVTTTQADAPSHLTFKHSGPFGDVIYSLAVIKAAGGGNLCVGDAAGPRVRMTRQLYNHLEPLIEIQPYIRGVEFAPDAQVDHDLDAFRPILREDHYAYGRTILSCIAQVSGTECPSDDKAWLTVDHSVMVDSKPIVINRTFRYRNHRFPWQKIADKYRDKCIFIGTRDEHALMQMQFQWPQLKRFPTANLLEAARVVAGCQLFIGNQSSLYAIAEGLKKPVIQEVFLFHPDCLFNREGSTAGWDENVFLPDL